MDTEDGETKSGIDNSSVRSATRGSPSKHLSTDSDPVRVLRRVSNVPEPSARAAVSENKHLDAPFAEEKNLRSDNNRTPIKEVDDNMQWVERELELQQAMIQQLEEEVRARDLELKAKEEEIQGQQAQMLTKEMGFANRERQIIEKADKLARSMELLRRHARQTGGQRFSVPGAGARQGRLRASVGPSNNTTPQSVSNSFARNRADAKHSTTAASMHKKLRKPAPFEQGGDVSWDEWLEKFENFVRDESEDEKIIMLKSYLNGSASRKLRSILRSDPDVDWSEILDLLTEEFTEPPELEEARFDLLKMKTGEPVADFIRRFNDQKSKLREEPSEAAALKRFKEALGQSVLRDELIRSNPRSLVHAQRLVKRWETEIQLHPLSTDTRRRKITAKMSAAPATTISENEDCTPCALGTDDLKHIHPTRWCNFAARNTTDDVKNIDNDSTEDDGDVLVLRVPEEQIHPSANGRTNSSLERE